jgi:hypothetical protein
MPPEALAHGRRCEREAVDIIFGDELSAAVTTVPADWIGPACDGARGTVGSLLPSRYESLLRVHAPEPDHADWWSHYRELFRFIASVGARHTSDAARAWFAVWEGHGFDTGTTHIAHRGPIDAATTIRLERERAALSLSGSSSSSGPCGSTAA